MMLFLKSYFKEKEKKYYLKTLLPLPMETARTCCRLSWRCDKLIFHLNAHCTEHWCKGYYPECPSGLANNAKGAYWGNSKKWSAGGKQNISTALYLILYCCTCYPPLYERTALLQHFMVADGNVLYNELFSYTYQICYMSPISLLGYYPIVYYLDVICNLLPPLFLSLTFSFA